MKSDKNLVLIGMMGSGKSTIGKLLSKKLNIDFIEGDEYHSNESLKKLSSGIALTDNDRIKWLNKLNDCPLTCGGFKTFFL